MKKIVIYAQNSLGCGHLTRMNRLASGLKNSHVTFIDGGLPFDYHSKKYKVVKLPLIRRVLADNTLRDQNNNLVGERVFQLRWKVLNKEIANLSCDVLWFDLFPFLWLHCRDEVFNLIEVIRRRNPKAKICCSLWDVLPYQKEKRAYDYVTNFAINIINELFDLVLHHGDPRITPFGEQFLFANHLHIPVESTGYVAPLDIQIYKNQRRKKPKILCLEGGGSLNYGIRDKILSMEKQLNKAFELDVLWTKRFFRNDGPRNTRNLVAAGNSAYRLFHQYNLIVCPAGYNTMSEVLRSCSRALVLPFNLEQKIRCENLLKKHPVSIIKETDCADSIMQKIFTAMEQPISASRAATEGITVSSRFINEL